MGGSSEWDPVGVLTGGGSGAWRMMEKVTYPGEIVSFVYELQY